MADYWKSNAKKFCQICKTWYADNKISIENHERGTKHKMMVQQRLRESAQKAQRKEREQAELNSTLRQMEQAAMASMLGVKGHEEPPRVDLVGPKPLSKTERERLQFQEQKRKLQELKRTGAQSQFWEGEEKPALDYGDQIVGSSSVVLDKEWVQAQHESGHVYYWHIHTGETQWDPPVNGFYTAAEYNAKYMTMVAASAAVSSAMPSSAVPSEIPLPDSSTIENQGGSSTSSALPDNLPGFTAMPQSSLAGADPFAVSEKRNDRRSEKRRAAREESEKEDGLEKKPRDEPVKLHLPSRESPTTKSDNPNPLTVKDEATDEERVPSAVVPSNDKSERTREEEGRKRSSAHPLGPWVPVVKEEKEVRLIADLPTQVIKKKPSEIVAEMEMDPSELQFQEKVLNTQTVSTKKSSKAIQFKKRTIANKGNLRQRTD